MSLTALCYNWAIFTVLGYAPFPMGLNEIELGLVFIGWGALVAIFAVVGAPWLQHRLGIARTLNLNLLLFAVVVLVIAIWTTHPPMLVVAVISTGVFIGVNNTVTTQAVMTIAPVERPIASAAYGFVRFVGGGLAPYTAGKLVEATNVHVPFYLGVVALLIGMAILATARRELAESERLQAASVRATPEPADLELRPVAYDGVVGRASDGSIVVAIDGAAVSDQVTAVARMGHSGRRPCPARSR